jgi:hypothetical protein
MKISPETLDWCIEYFKSDSLISNHFIMRKFKIGFDMAVAITDEIERRYPDEWKNRYENFTKKSEAIK